jgi:hypothetical protein
LPLAGLAQRHDDNDDDILFDAPRQLGASRNRSRFACQSIGWRHASL